MDISREGTYCLKLGLFKPRGTRRFGASAAQIPMAKNDKTNNAKHQIFFINIHQQLSIIKIPPRRSISSLE
jgi:hypothetical protein